MGNFSGCVDGLNPSVTAKDIPSIHRIIGRYPVAVVDSILPSKTPPNCLIGANGEVTIAPGLFITIKPVLEEDAMQAYG